MSFTKMLSDKMCEYINYKILQVTERVWKVQQDTNYTFGMPST